MLREGHPIGTILVTRARAGALLGASDRAAEDLRRPGRHRHRERAPVPGAARRATAISPRRWSSRPRPARSCASSASSPTDVQPVFDTIVESAVRLCDGVSATVYRFDGDAHSRERPGSTCTPEAREAFQRRYPAPRAGQASWRRRFSTGPSFTCATSTRDAGRHAGEPRKSRAAGHRSLISIPMLRDGSPIGAIAVGRRAEGEGRGHSPIARSPCSRPSPTRPSSPSRTSASSQELETRNRDLTEALEQQTATSEILEVISRSPSDLQPVLETIIESAVRLCGADLGFIYRHDGERYTVVAAHGATRRVRRDHGKPSHHCWIEGPRRGGRSSTDESCMSPTTARDPEYSVGGSGCGRGDSHEPRGPDAAGHHGHRRDRGR